MRADLADEMITQLGREVARQSCGEHFLIGQLASEHVVLESQLDVCHQRRQFRRRQAQPGFGSPADLLLRWQCLEFTVQPAFGDEVLDHSGVHRQQAGRVGAAGAHEVVLVLLSVSTSRPTSSVIDRSSSVRSSALHLARGDQRVDRGS